ncbi:MAG: hypothetical protein H8D22_04780 [Candidatus Cloacimonetes bacterium]|nr:hypothetical protein [Candidatus Cloacimonadota bacterium]
MKTKRFITMVAIILIIAISSLSAAEDDSTYIKGRAVIKVTNVFNQFSIGDDGYVETEKEWFNTLSDQYQIYELNKVFNSNHNLFRYYYRIYFPEDFEVLDVCDDFKLEDNVRFALPDYKAEPCLIPDDPFYHYQWALTKVQADSAWDVAVSNQDTIVIGVVDTGVDVALPSDPTTFLPHPDLTDNLYMVNDSLIGYYIHSPGDLPNGIYFMKAISNKQVATKKILIIH